MEYDLDRQTRAVLITGGAGFIGSNLTDRLISMGRRVIVLDNLSRAGVRQNLEWLRSEHRGMFHLEVADVRDRTAVRHAVKDCDFVFHLAAQVAVTTSVVNPVLDFEVNAGGTLAILEEIRRLPEPPGLLFTSTNKVYGALQDVELTEKSYRYEPQDDLIARCGISERRPLEFHTPFGCSKGTADQYVLDYARAYGIPAAVFRMSCIYGPHQFGNEDQGWLAHLLIRAMNGQAITLFGDGKQVRDVLFIDDLLDAFLLAQRYLREISGRAFNIGGGPKNTLSLMEVLELIPHLCDYHPKLGFEGWRSGDQRYYVSDNSSFHAVTGWYPKVGVFEGIARLHDWISEYHLPPQVPILVREAG